jgi:hypothetical protein
MGRSSSSLRRATMQVTKINFIVRVTYEILMGNISNLSRSRLRISPCIPSAAPASPTSALLWLHRKIYMPGASCAPPSLFTQSDESDLHHAFLGSWPYCSFCSGLPTKAYGYGNSLEARWWVKNTSSTGKSQKTYLRITTIVPHGGDVYQC